MSAKTSRESSNGNMSDVVIIGGGIAGATAAAVLARQGIRVVLVDRWETYPECFKAEKIESDQAILLRSSSCWTRYCPGPARFGRYSGRRKAG